MRGSILLAGVMVVLAVFARETECRALSSSGEEFYRRVVTLRFFEKKESQTEESSEVSEYERDGEYSTIEKLKEDLFRETGFTYPHWAMTILGISEPFKQDHQQNTGKGAPLAGIVAPAIKCGMGQQRGRDGRCHKGVFV